MVTPRSIKLFKTVENLEKELGSTILRLLNEGYRKFIIEDLGEVIEIKTWRLRRK